MRPLRVPPIGDTERALPMRLESVDPSQRRVRGAASILRAYEIRGVGTGAPAFDAIARKIILQKLRSGWARTRVPWNELIVAPVNVALEVEPERLAGTLDDNYERLFSGVFPEKRRREILSYAEAMGDDWPLPLFVHAGILGTAATAPGILGRFLRPRVDLPLADCAFSIDGTRRVCAAALRGRAEVPAEILVSRSMLPAWLAPSRLEEVQTLLKQISWFPDYQHIPEVGITGKRTLRRYRLLDLAGVEDGEIADFGCNTGQACLEYYYQGARRVYGFDVQQEAVDVANLVSHSLGIGDRVTFHRIDFNDPDCFSQMDGILPPRLDFTSFFSVYRTKELTQREELFRYILGKTGRQCFFEGHANVQTDTVAFYQALFRKFGKSGRFVGYSERVKRTWKRPLFVVS